MTECDFNWRMMKNIFTECHIYDEKANYKVRARTANAACRPYATLALSCAQQGVRRPHHHTSSHLTLF